MSNEKFKQLADQVVPDGITPVILHRATNELVDVLNHVELTREPKSSGKLAYNAQELTELLSLNYAEFVVKAASAMRANNYTVQDAKEFVAYLIGDYCDLLYV